MAFERLVGLDVGDDAEYQRYREGMMPILARYGGLFRYDFVVAKTLTSETSTPINRVFVLSFPDEPSHDAFFSDAAYLVVRDAHFSPSVRGTTVIARFHR